MKLKNEDGSEDKYIVNNCNKVILFGDITSKGKKNDNVFCNAYLTCIIKYFDDGQINARKTKVVNNIVHTDN